MITVNSRDPIKDLIGQSINLLSLFVKDVWCMVVAKGARPLAVPAA
uniref:Uncharacterized protein n=1 Tax=Moniliophthora roreri TaxID=221103 RepID=A0A0W0FP72_MONRR